MEWWHRVLLGESHSPGHLQRLAQRTHREKCLLSPDDIDSSSCAIFLGHASAMSLFRLHKTQRPAGARRLPNAVHAKPVALPPARLRADTPQSRLSANAALRVGTCCGRKR